MKPRMKLSTKIALLGTAFLIFLSQISAFLSIKASQQRVVERLLRDEWKILSNDTSQLQNDFGELQQIAPSQEDFGILLKQLYQKKIYRKYTVLYRNGRELINQTPYSFNFEKANRFSGGSKKPFSYDPNVTYLETFQGRKLLFLHSFLSSSYVNNPALLEEPFSLLRFVDVTDIYQEGQSLLLWSLLPAALLSLLLAMLLSFLVNRMLRPLYRLKHTAEQIAKGQYQMRVECSAQNEVAQIADSFNHMAQQVEQQITALQQLNEKQTRLLGALSHELKTPMTSIQGYAQLLQRVALPEKQRQQSLCFIEEECRHLSRLSEKMLQLVELSREGSIEQQPLLPSRLFAQASSCAEPLLASKKLRLKICLKNDRPILGDPDLLLSLLSNLIHNSCKASPAQGVITLIETDLGLFVKDQGPGIPPDEQDRILEPFYRIDKARSRKEGGAGLGLALCHQIARLHGGTLLIKNNPDKGCCIGILWRKP